MALIRIGESLHCHIPSVQQSGRRWLLGDMLDREAGTRHLRKLVYDQVAAGASYLDVNVDDFLQEDEIGRDGCHEIMGYILRLIVEEADGTPPCIDSSDPEILEWGLLRYQELAGPAGPAPMVNSIAVSRLDTLELRRRFPFSAIGMLLEKAGESAGFTEITDAGSYHETARFIFEKARAAGFENGEILFDPTVGPLGADMVGYTHRTFEGIRMISSDREMAGVHVCIGLSNCSDGLPRRLAINRAYLRVAMEFGVDAAILDATQITGEELVDGRVLKLIRRLAAGDAADALSLLVDYARAHPTPPAPGSRPPVPDPFGAALTARGERIYLLEMAPAEGNVEQIYAMAEAAKDTPFIFAITDTPGGNRVPGPDTIAVEVARITNRQPIVNLSCKSDDRNGLYQRILGLYHQGLHNFFAVTGDYAATGRASFDLDSVNLLMVMNTLRRGLDYPSLLPRPGAALEGLRMGAAVSPFKYLEPDLWGQYLKLWKKRQSGADFFITQLGYDVAKFQELRLYMERAGLGAVPAIAGVYFLTPQFLKILNRVHVAGVVIPDDLKKKYRGQLVPKAERSRLRKMSFVELAEYQKRMSIRRAALLADIVVRGFGYKGVDLGGITEFEDALEIMATIRELEARDWRENLEEYRDGDGERPLQLAPEDPFYLFPPGDDGLLADGPFQRGDYSTFQEPDLRMERLHHTFFEEGGWGHGLIKWAVGGAEEAAKTRLAVLAEQAIKRSTLGCEMCGDCRIADLQYLCPEPSSGCAKRLLNGPCGGADENGFCEVVRDRRCYWAQVIERALRAGEANGLTRIQPPKDPQLAHTSSWRNDLLGKCAAALDLGHPQEAVPRL